MNFENNELKKRYTDSDVAERDRILSEHKSNVRELERQRAAAVTSQRDKLEARLTARKLHQEQLTRERAVNDEMARISLAQVCTRVE